MPSYDLNTPGAVREIKQALVALARLDSKKETIWTSVTDSDIWDELTGEEFLLAVSRYRGLGVEVPEPYAQPGPSGGTPQPTVNGLELIAGAANDAKSRGYTGGLLVQYEKWRCGLLGALTPCLTPPSILSRPSSDTVVTPTQNIGWVINPLPSTPQQYMPAIIASESMLRAVYASAMLATTEEERANMVEFMKQARFSRETAVQTALDSTPAQPGQPGLPGQPPKTSPGSPGTPDSKTASVSGDSKSTVWLVVGAAALGLYWIFKR